ncbi:MAG: RNA polymerase sigma factor [Acidobacteria bacterium]|nr:RNA polymerase sigma factor [Acidobacteriota bacterium]MCZ6878559.1 RNA polymerase sigma factor [Acidobacteriota bacterium]
MARTDAQLVKATLEGEPHAFEEIVGRYQRLVFHIVYHYLGRRDEVEDLAQEVFLKVFRSLDTFDAKRPLKAWISRITANTCLDEVRKARKRKIQLFADLGRDEEDRVEYFYERFSQHSTLSERDVQELFELLEKLMGRLNEKDKMAFVLRELEGLSYPEIAQTLETTELAARIRVSRSKRRLQKDLEQVLYSGKKIIDA